MNKIPLTPEQKEDFSQLAVEMITAMGMTIQERYQVVPSICKLLRNRELLNMAWALIANASGGDWKQQDEVWQENAMQWRQIYVGFLQAEEDSHKYFFEMVDAELKAQKVNGYDDKHDDTHDKGELCEAAAAYALATISKASREQARASVWPFEPAAFNPQNPARDIVRSIGFLIAELKRLERLNKQ